MPTKKAGGPDYSGFISALDRASLDPSGWDKVCDEFAAIVGATGALIFPFDTTHYGVALPHSSSLQEVFRRYIAGGWVEKDTRFAGLSKARREGFMTDQDLIAREDMARHPYYAELLVPANLQWSATVSLDAGSSVWGVCVHGSPERGAFQRDEVARLLQVRKPLELALRRASMLGNQRIELLETAFAASRPGFALLDWAGRIVWQNASAEAMLRKLDLVASGRIRSRDPLVERQLADLVGRVIGFHRVADIVLPRPVVVTSPDRRRFSIDAIPMPRDFEALASRASTLLSITELAGQGGRSGLGRLKDLYGLTPREVELCGHLLAGTRLVAAADLMRISVSTCRQHVKSVFAKTGTHGQAELVALLGRLDHG